MIRRAFFTYVVGMVSAAFMQKGIMQNGKAVICDGDSITCPLGHKTCKVINAPIVVGNDRYDYPDQSQLHDYHVCHCNTCKVLFTLE
jgi:hypothetical protein